MKKRVLLVVLLVGVLGVLSAGTNAEYTRCPWCGSTNVPTVTTYYVTDTYRTACTHYTEGYDTHTLTNYVYKSLCPSCDHYRDENWSYISDTVACHGWEPNPLY